MSQLQDGRRQMLSSARDGAIEGPTKRMAQQATVWRQEFSSFLIEHLADGMRVFGDLEAMLIIAVLRDKFLRVHLSAAVKIIPPNECLDDSVTASEIAQRTGIPRQTVRRKLLSLEQRGLVTQTDKAAWRLISSQEQAVMSTDIASLENRGIDRVATLRSSVEPLSRRHTRRRDSAAFIDL
jgi:DNA-binding transcriptional ArsR family regulator